MGIETHLAAAQICIQARVPLFLWGGSGIGKTANIEASAPSLGEPLWVIILSIREPSDQGGLPVVRAEWVEMHPPKWAKELIKAGHGIAFWDEFNTSPPAVQNSMLRVVQDGWAGDAKLPENTSHVAAGNPPHLNTGAYHLNAAISNRWCQIDWPVDRLAWCDGMVAGWPTPETRLVPPEWKNRVPSKRGLVASFIRRKDLLYKPPASAAEQGRSWPSPRTWTMAATLSAAAEAAGCEQKSAVTRLLVEGCVGGPAMSEFYTWLVALDLRDPEEYLADPLGCPLPKRQDQIMATLDGVAAASLDTVNHKRKAMVGRYRGAWKVLGRIIKAQGDIGIPAARILAAHMPAEVERDLPEEVLDILPILEAANISFARSA